MQRVTRIRLLSAVISSSLAAAFPGVVVAQSSVADQSGKSAPAAAGKQSRAQDPSATQPSAAPQSSSAAQPTPVASDTAPPAEAPSDEDVSELEKIVVTGIRATQQTSTMVKRDSTVIMDALVNDEIGASPDLSVGETLERITGVTADRFKGSASEVSVRGLGPFLGFSTFNGREVSSGGSDRAVSFQQFPSEIVNGVEVYKTQRADFVEGGTSGIINLKTIRPLVYGKKSFQVDVRGSYNDRAANVSGDDGLGFRGSFSAVDQWDTGIGRIGAAIGYSHIDSTAPEDYYSASSSFRPCNSINLNPTLTTGGNCGYNPTSTNPVYFVANQYGFRQLRTEDNRDALIAALQWRPNEDWDINLDLQASERQSLEFRHDLSIAEGRRGITPVDLADNGALRVWQGNSYLENVNTDRDRTEKYLGGGFNVEWRALDILRLSADLSYSRTDRDQVDFATRLRTNALVGPSGRIPYTFDQTSNIPGVVFGKPIDLDDPNIYSTNAYARRHAEERDDEISALRFDGTLDVDRGLLTTLQAGVRYSEHIRRSDPDADNNLESIPADRTAAGQANCQLAFPQDDWGHGSGTNISSWAVFDTRCLYRAFTGVDDLGFPTDSRSAADIDVKEDISAGYFLANFAGELGSLPFSGNIGLRAERTDISSRGFRGDYTVTNSGGNIVLDPVPGSFETITIRHRSSELLPSFNVSFELRDDLLLRGAAYKALSRPNLEDMGAGRDFVLDNTGGTVEEAIAGVSGGNPRLEPLLSNNYDLSLEWYANQGTSLALALYYKQLKAGIVPAFDNVLNESFVIDGTTYVVPVAQQTNSDRKRDLYGVEVSAQHAMTYLPAPFDGLGFIIGYNYADSNFEYADPSATDASNPLRNFTEPAGILGLSKHSGSATVYYEGQDWSVRALYKYRSEYFKPFLLASNRVAEGGGFLDLSADFRLTRQLQLKLSALNVLGNSQEMYRPVAGSTAESSYFGKTYFVGLRFRY